jgi:hypothetical protein
MHALLGVKVQSKVSGMAFLQVENSVFRGADKVGS